MATEPALTRVLARRLCVAAVALLAALVAAFVAGESEPAGAAKLKTIGKTKSTPRPTCPAKKTGGECSVIGRVTGYQSKVEGERGLFKVRGRGHLVAWSVDLGRPNREERGFFGGLFGGRGFDEHAAARLAVIKQAEGSRFKLKKQGAAVDLSSELGSRPVITLDEPLRVRRGDIAALTVPTWLPNFAVEQSRKTVWRSSRSPKRCEPRNDSNRAVEEFARKSKPHDDVGTTRRYGCTYNTARLLYWAYFLPAGGGGKDGGGKDGGGKDGGGKDGGGN